MFSAIMEKAPPELVCVPALRIAPPAPWLAKAVHGKPVIALFICHTGPSAEGEKLVAQIKAFGQPVGDIIQRRPYISQQSLLDATQPKGRRYYWKSEYLPRVEPDLIATLIKHAEKSPRPTRRSYFFHSIARSTGCPRITRPWATGIPPGF